MGELLTDVAGEEIPVSPKIRKNLIEPLLPVPECCEGSDVAHDVHVRHEALALPVPSFPEGGTLDDGKCSAEAREVEGLAGDMRVMV